MVKKRYVVVAILGLCAVLLCLTIANSFNISLLLRGYNPQYVSTIYNSVDNNGEEIQIALLKTENNANDTLVVLAKNSLNWWYIQWISDFQDENGLIGLSWQRASGIQNIKNEPLILGQERHHFLIGNNAKALIRLTDDQLPANTTVHIEQSETSYLLHFISFSDTKNQYSLQKEIGSILKTGGYIE